VESAERRSSEFCQRACWLQLRQSNGFKMPSLCLLLLLLQSDQEGEHARNWRKLPVETGGRLSSASVFQWHERGLSRKYVCKEALRPHAVQGYQWMDRARQISICQSRLNLAIWLINLVLPCVVVPCSLTRVKQNSAIGLERERGFCPAKVYLSKVPFRLSFYDPEERGQRTTLVRIPHGR
jgi:hypothetical protein